MRKKNALLLILSVTISLLFALPAYAQEESWALGGGYFSLPNVDDEEGALDTSGMFACMQMKSGTYFLELDLSLTDTKFFALAADYIYPVSSGTGGIGGAFFGAGYTYFSSQDLDDTQGFNLVAGAEFGSGISGTIRYDFLGSDQEMLTVGVTYSFQ